LARAERAVGILLVGLLLGWLGGGCANLAAPAEAEMYQVSTLQAIVEGVYDGVIPVGELRRHGDFGIGTFHGLDGELVMVDGFLAQVKGDGAVVVPLDTMTTPLACVTWFAPGRTVPVPAGMNLAGFTAWLDGELGNLNLPYAVRVRGDFRRVKTRSVPAQRKPYPRLAEVTATQAVFELAATRGDIVGFRLPGYFGGINLPGYHLHYLNDAHTQGGHLLDVETGDGVVVEIQALRRLSLILPEGGDFATAELSGDKSAELRKAEQ
jgi:acetolactate decarboxylase